MIGKLEERDFDKWLSQSEIAARDQATGANDAFAAAMNKAIRRGKERARPGIYIDLTPPIGARRIAPQPVVSCCGSPAAMCMENAVPENGTSAMK
jgi:hypothetical protein